MTRLKELSGAVKNEVFGAETQLSCSGREGGELNRVSPWPSRVK